MPHPRKPRKPTQPNSPDIIALPSYRERLQQGHRARRSDALFAAADPAAAIRALPPDEFFYVIHELGFPEAMEVLVHGTAEQVQAALDFSLWEQDRLALDKSDDWLAALVEAPIEALGRWAGGIDVELLAFLIRQRATVHDLSVEEPPEDPAGVLWESPDRFFVLELKGDADQVRVTQRLVDGLYRYSPGMMRRLLVGVRAESDAELEETAYRWRCGRMADLGFADFYEALAVYQELDPASVRIPDQPAPSPRPKSDTAADAFLRLPAVLTERLAGKTPLARAVAGLGSRSEAADVHFALVALANRALSADRVAPGDDDAVRGVLERVSATLDLALEFLARGDRVREVAAVRNVPLVTLHRLGASLTGKLRRLARALRHDHPFAKLRPAIALFEPEDAEVLASLSRLRPCFPRLLASPPAAGDRPFASLADLAAATRAVQRAAAALDLIAGLGVRPAQLEPAVLEAQARAAGWETPAAIDPSTIDTGSLARTMLVARLLDPAVTSFAPLAGDAALAFKNRFNSDGQLSEITALTAEAILRGAAGAHGFEGVYREVAERWIASLQPLGPVLTVRPSGPP